MKKMNRILSALLVFVMLVGLLPAGVLRGKAAETDAELTAALDEAKNFIDGLTVNNSANDPATVVSTWGTQFSWDNEKRESNKKSYLFEWSYYNGVVFEGLDYVYDYTKDETYKNYVAEYLSSMIDGNTVTWKTCSNGKSCAGYNSTHGVDCYKTASLLLDYGYYEMAKELYGDLQDAQDKYLAPNTDGNYEHTWASSSTYAVWLDGLYMVQPFLAEYAAYSGDTAEQDRIFDRFAWISANMYDEATGLFYHAANSANDYYNNNKQYWGRAIGWYAAALVDVMEHMPEGYRDVMSEQLKKLVDGMTRYQENDGMWRNFVNVGSAAKESSVTALMAYAIMKAVNNGWLDDSYAQYATKAFKGLCSYALDDSGLHYICMKGSTSAYSEVSYGSYTNEGKGVGPFIMAYAQILQYSETEPSTEVPPVTDEDTGVVVEGDGITNLIVQVVEALAAPIVEKLEELAEKWTCYDITPEGHTAGSEAIVRIPVPAGYDTSRLAVYHVNETTNELELMPNGGVIDVDGKAYYQFSTTHFSQYVVTEQKVNTDWIEIPGKAGGTTYTQVTGNNLTAGQYVIVNSQSNGTRYALDLTQSSNRRLVTVSDGTITGDVPATAIFTLESSGSGFKIKDSSDKYLYPNATRSNGNWSYELKENQASGETVTFTVSGNGYTLSRSVTSNRRNTTAYLYYSSGYSAGSSSSTLYLYKVVTTEAADPTWVKMEGSDASLYNGDTANLDDLIKIYTNKTNTGDGTPVANLAADANINWKINGVASQATTVTQTSTVEVLYGTTSLGTINITFQEKPAFDKTQPNWNLPVAPEPYPVYPDDGAVRVDKTATNNEGFPFWSTGVTKVELDVAGITTKSAVDVVMINDISNSMAWYMGSTSESDFQSKCGTYDFTKSKMYALQQAVGTFADELFSAGGDHTVSLVTFAGYDADHTNTQYNTYADSVQTLLLASQSANDIKNTINGIDFHTTGNGTYYISFEGNATTSSSQNYGNTNYDYAFMQAAAAIEALYNKHGGEDAYKESGREIVVMFMTDGAPSNVNGVYYQYRSGDRADVDATWMNRNGESVTYQMGRGSNSNYTTTISTTDTTSWLGYLYSQEEVYWATKVAGMTGVTDITAVGFEILYGGFSSYTFNYSENGTTKSYIEGYLQDHILGKAGLDVTNATDTETLNKYYHAIAESLKHAGTEAEVTDVVDSDFTLQLGNFGTIGGDTTPHESKIEVIGYDLWKKSETDNNDLIGTRKGTPTPYETVTFSADGTVAYSSVKGEGVNIMTINDDGSVIIEADYFTYTKTADGKETFKWNIGTITDQEIALSFYAYLKGARENTATPGTHYTNEEAYVEYIDVNGNYARQEFPVPSIAWGRAVTTVEYYLVNKNGQPVNYSGQIIPFANRIKIGETYSIGFNYGQDNALTVKAADYKALCNVSFPLYNQDASYTVWASQDAYGSLTLTTGARWLNEDNTACDATRVAFAVVLPENVTVITPVAPDTTVVIDFGKPIHIDMTTALAALKNGITITVKDASGNTIGTPVQYNDVEVELLGFTDYLGDNVGEATTATVQTEHFGSYRYGHFLLAENNTVIYTPRTMNVQHVEQVYVVFQVTDKSNTSNKVYACATLSIVPATDVYYEAEDFITESDWTKEGTATVDRQDNGLAGTGNYGYDSNYQVYSDYSGGAAWSVTVPATTTAVADMPTMTFTFSGTGFDLFSATNPDQSMIRVEVFDDAGTKVKTVSVINTGTQDLKQLPVLSVEGLPYGTYTATVTAFNAYENESFPSLNRGGTTVIDAIRVHDPIKTAEKVNRAYETVDKVYVKDGEANQVITEIRDQLIASGSFDPNSDTGIVFLDSNVEGGISDYATVGPNNEVYLSKGQAIGFVLRVDKTPASIQIGAKTVSSTSATMQILSGDAKSQLDSKTVTSATAQFYKLTMPTFVENEDGTMDVVLYVKNIGEGVLSITDLKVTFAETGAKVSFPCNTAVAETFWQVIEDAQAPVIRNAEFATQWIRFGRDTKIQVTLDKALRTGDDFAITLNGRTYRTTGWGIYKLNVSAGTQNADGTWTYTLTMKPLSISFMSDARFKIYLLNSEGNPVGEAELSARINLF